MSWAARVRDVFSGQEGQRQRLDAALSDIHASILAVQVQLARHAESSPTAATARTFAKLAQTAGATAESLRTALQERGVTPRRFIAAAAEPAELNHWSRIVDDLERQRALRNQILACAAGFAESDAGAAALLDQLLRRVDELGAALRGEVARADPQAIN